MLKGIGFPLLLVALVLTAGMPSGQAFPPAILDKTEQSVSAGDGMYAAVVRTSPVLVDLSGWELYLHSATDGLSSYGLNPSTGTLPAAGDGVAGAGMAPQAPPALLFRAPYQPQAPPSPV
jgi:hypothetical protein